MWDPNQGRYVGSCLLDVINTLRKGDYAEGSSGLLLNESFPLKQPGKGVAVHPGIIK